jgi:lipopolysaccharide/colanic/teichoic acid biosynthesis glycosyltransferase
MLAKRIFDIFFAMIGLILFSPVMVVIAVLVFIDGGRPLVFTQERLGLGMLPFRIYKFRSMREGDVTQSGRWIRATGLDEVLQFVNVLRGEMSMVGPRPLTRDDLVRLGWLGNPARFVIKPGVTGLAQLYAGRGARQSAFLDAKYAERQSAWLDSKIITASFVANVVGKRHLRQWLRRRRHAR